MDTRCSPNIRVYSLVESLYNLVSKSKLLGYLLRDIDCWVHMGRVDRDLKPQQLNQEIVFSDLKYSCKGMLTFYKGNTIFVGVSSIAGSTRASWYMVYNLTYRILATGTRTGINAFIFNTCLSCGTLRTLDTFWSTTFIGISYVI